MAARGNNTAAPVEDVIAHETRTTAEGSPRNASSDSFSTIDMGSSIEDAETVNVLNGPGVDDGRMGGGAPGDLLHGDYDLDESTDTLAEVYQCTFHGQLHRNLNFKLQLEAKVEEEDLYKPDPAKFPSRAWRMGCWKSTKAERANKVCTHFLLFLAAVCVCFRAYIKNHALVSTFFPLSFICLLFASAPLSLLSPHQLILIICPLLIMIIIYIFFLPHHTRFTVICMIHGCLMLPVPSRITSKTVTTTSTYGQPCRPSQMGYWNATPKVAWPGYIQRLPRPAAGSPSSLVVIRLRPSYPP